MSELFTDVPYKDLNAELARLTGDPEFVYHGQVIPPGHDAEADRLRSLGRVQVFRFKRVARARNIDPVAHRLMRKG